MGSTPSRNENTKNIVKQKSENDTKEMNRGDVDKTDAFQQSDARKARPHIDKNDTDESYHEAAIRANSSKREASRQSEEAEQEQKRHTYISDLKSRVNHQLERIQKCEKGKMNPIDTINMSRRLQQFCILNELVPTEELGVSVQITNKLAEKKQEKTRLLHKLSEIAGTRLKHNNPNLADLSDENRPTKLVNRLSELYDNDWTDIFERVREKIRHDVDDKEIICYLRVILKQCYEHCRTAANTQRQNILQRLLTGISTHEAEPTLLLYINNLQKKSAECSIKFLTTSIKEVLKTSPVGILLTDKKSADPVYCKYVEGCTEIMWHTQIQSPPIYLDFETTNKDWFKKFTSPGNVIDYIVWPVVFLHENGPLLAKGIAQFSKAKEKETPKTQVFYVEDESRADNVMTESNVQANTPDTSNYKDIVSTDHVVNKNEEMQNNQEQRDTRVETRKDKQSIVTMGDAVPINTKALALTAPVVTESSVKINEEQQNAKVGTRTIKDKIDKRKTVNVLPEVGTNVKRPKAHKNKRK